MAPDPTTLVDSRPTVREALDLGAAALREAGIDDGQVDAEWLLAETLGTARGRLGLQARQALEPGDVARYVSALHRRIADALVPRPETELLAGWALELLPGGSRPPLAIDVGTGTGCIACALGVERPDLTVIALDASPAAVALARDNVAALGLAARVTVQVSDLFSAVTDAQADVIVSNPPYLRTALISTLAPEVSRHDPRLALDGGPDGLDVIRRLVDAAPRWLASAGWLVLETAGGGQVPAVVALMRACGFVSVQTRPDLAGIVRFVAGGMPSCQHVC